MSTKIIERSITTNNNITLTLTHDSAGYTITATTPSGTMVSIANGLRSMLIAETVLNIYIINHSK